MNAGSVLALVQEQNNLGLFENMKTDFHSRCRLIRFYKQLICIKKMIIAIYKEGANREKPNLPKLTPKPKLRDRL